MNESATKYEQIWPDHWMKKTWIDALFAKMTAIYGNRWLEVYPNEETIDEAKTEWADALGSRMTGERIKAGLTACRAELAWPPSISQFLERAKSPPAAHRAYKALPPVKPEKELGQQSVRTMREILAGHEAGELIPEHREMLKKNNPALLARIEASYPGNKGESAT